MNTSERAMAEQVAQVAIAFQAERTGHAPASVTVVLSEDTLVIALHDALTAAEKALALSSEGAAQVQEFHRQLFQSSADSLRKEIKRITGREAREAAAEVEPGTGTVVLPSPQATSCRSSCSPRAKRPQWKPGMNRTFGPEHGESAMLILSRKNLEAVVVSGVSGFEPVLGVSGGRVKLGFEAAKEVPIHRAKVWERMHVETEASDPRAGIALPSYLEPYPNRCRWAILQKACQPRVVF